MEGRKSGKEEEGKKREKNRKRREEGERGSKKGAYNSPSDNSPTNHKLLLPLHHPYCVPVKREWLFMGSK